MNFATTGLATGLPAWPQASARPPILSATPADGFALAVEGALSLHAVADGATIPAADARPNVATPSVDPDVWLPVPAALALPTGDVPAASRPILRLSAAAVPLPVQANAESNPASQPLGATAATVPPPPVERQEALDAAISDAPDRVRPSQAPPPKSITAATTLATAPTMALANPAAPAEPRARGATNPAAPWPDPIEASATKAAPIVPAPVLPQPDAAISRGAARLTVPYPSAQGVAVPISPVAPIAGQAATDAPMPSPQAPMPLEDAPSSTAPPANIPIPNIPAAASAPVEDVATSPATPRAAVESSAPVPPNAEAGVDTKLQRAAPPAVAAGGAAAPRAPDATPTRSLAPDDKATSIRLPGPAVTLPVRTTADQAMPRTPVAIKALAASDGVEPNPGTMAVAKSSLLAMPAAEPVSTQAADTQSRSNAPGASRRIVPARPGAEPGAAMAPPPLVARPAATERLPSPTDIAPPSAPVLAGPFPPTAGATMKPVASIAEPVAADAPLLGVLAAQTVPLMRAASLAAAGSASAPLQNAVPTAPALRPAPAPRPVPAAAAPAATAPALAAGPALATGGATRVQQASPAAATLDPAPANADAKTAVPTVAVAVAAQPAKASHAKPTATLTTAPDLPPASFGSVPRTTVAPASRATTSERAIAEPPSRPAADEPEPAQPPATAADRVPIPPPMLPVAIPLHAPATPAADTATPHGMRRASLAPSAIAPGSPPAAARDATGAARDPAQATVSPDAPRFADALPAPAAPAPPVADAKPAIAPLVAPAPLHAASAPLVEPRARAADLTPAPVITAQPGHIGRDLGVEIARRVSVGGNELVVRLAPAELGRIEVRMSFDDRGGLTTVIAADSPVALDMLRRDSADLSRSLNDAGFRSDGQSLRFDGGGGDRGGDRGGGQPRSPWQNANPKPGQSADFGPASDFEESRYRPLRTSGRYDLMA